MCFSRRTVQTSTLEFGSLCCVGEFRTTCCLFSQTERAAIHPRRRSSPSSLLCARSHARVMRRKVTDPAKRNVVILLIAAPSFSRPVCVPVVMRGPCVRPFVSGVGSRCVRPTGARLSSRCILRFASPRHVPACSRRRGSPLCVVASRVSRL